MNKKQIIIITIAGCCILIAGWLFLKWYNDPLRREEAERQNNSREYDRMWETPISFYGKVVDEKGNPVVGADVQFFVNDTSREGTSEYHRKGDDKGLFSLTGVKGYTVQVRVSREGYYLDRLKSFYSAGSDKNLPSDPKNPFVFQLRKKGEIPKLLRGYRGFDLPANGAAVEVNLLTAEVVPDGAGHIKVECSLPDRNAKQPYDWSCRISVPRGGLQEAVGEFLFEAHEKGYRPLDEINMPVSSGENWNLSIDRKYYLKLGDGNYAVLSFEAQAGNRVFYLEYYLNPNGSRNLEHEGGTIPPGVSTTR
jgi:hypothetical protein